MLEEREAQPHRERLGAMLVEALDGATTAATLQASLADAEGAAGAAVDAARSKGRSRLAELQRSARWKAERVAAGVDHLMGERPAGHACLIEGTGLPMRDPVTDAVGNTYERAAITKWLMNNDTSPATGAQLPHKNLTPNNVLKSMIQEWEEQEHKRCMAMAKAAPPPLARHDTAALTAALAQRKAAKAAKAESSGAAQQGGEGAAASSSAEKRTAAEAELGAEPEAARDAKAAKD